MLIFRCVSISINLKFKEIQKDITYANKNITRMDPNYLSDFLSHRGLQASVYFKATKLNFIERAKQVIKKVLERHSLRQSINNLSGDSI